MPFSAVGGEECYEILLDGNDLLRSPLGPLIERLHPRPDLLPPLVRGWGPLPEACCFPGNRRNGRPRLRRLGSEA